MSQTLIRSKLIKTVSDYAAAKVPALTVARENTAFTKPANQATFLEVTLSPANTQNPNVASDTRRFYGDLMINVWVKEGSGAGVAEAIAEELSQIFTVFPCQQLPVYITSHLDIKRAVSDPSGYRVTALCVSYRADF